MSVDLTDALPTLEGRQVRLRQLGGDDLVDLLAVFSDARVLQYWSHAPLRSAEEIAWYLRDIDAGRRHGTHFQWGIERVASAGVIGTLTLFAFDRRRTRAEVGFALARAHWGAGHAREALRLALDFAFGALLLEAIDARVDPRNAASLRLLVGAGFVQGQDVPSKAGAERGPRVHLHLDADRNSLFH